MNIALITEGVTDQIVIKPIVESIFEQEDIHFFPLQPTLDNTDRQSNFGGWHMVLETLRHLDLTSLFQNNDFLIVHVDSDVSHLKGFDLPHSISGGKVDVDGLLRRIIQKLSSLAPMAESDERHRRILYAIGIHSIECWLIGLVDPTHSYKRVNGCLVKLNQALKKKKHNPISSTAKNSGDSRRTYLALANQFQNKKTTLQQSQLNPGFKQFVSLLQTAVNPNR